MAYIYRRAGSKNWYLGDIDPHGTMIRKSLGTTDKETAKSYLNSYEYAKTRGELGLINDRKTYLEYKIEHTRDINSFAQSTRRIYQDALKNFERIIGVPNLLLDVTPTIIHNWQNKRRIEMAGKRSTILSPTSINMELRCLKAFFEHAKDMKLLTTNPAESINYLTIEKSAEEEEHQHLSHEQIRVLLEATKSSEEINLMAHIYIFAGLRCQEGTHLRWQDIDFNRNILSIKAWGGWTLKDHEDREMPINPELFKALQAAPRNSELVCPGKYGIRERCAVGRAFNRIYSKTSLPFSGVHVLRHTCITHLVNSGVPIPIVQKWVGHANSKTTEGYIHRDRTVEQDYMRRADFFRPTQFTAHSQNSTVD